jgi:hypothetical protein
MMDIVDPAVLQVRPPLPLVNMDSSDSSVVLENATTVCSTIRESQLVQPSPTILQRRPSPRSLLEPEFLQPYSRPLRPPTASSVQLRTASGTATGVRRLPQSTPASVQLWRSSTATTTSATGSRRSGCCGFYPSFRSVSSGTDDELGLAVDRSGAVYDPGSNRCIARGVSQHHHANCTSSLHHPTARPVEVLETDILCLFTSRRSLFCDYPARSSCCVDGRTTMRLRTRYYCVMNWSLTSIPETKDEDPD